MNTKSRLKGMLPIFVLLLAVDQATKRLAVAWLKGSPPRYFFGGIFCLDYAENSGTFLSLGAGLPANLRFWLLTVGTGALMLGLIIYTLFARDMTQRMLFSLSLVIAGGTSNWIDRVMMDGYVRDFMIVGISSLHSGVFNIADLLILVGPLILLTDTMRPEHTRRDGG